MKDFFNAYEILKVKQNDTTVVIKKAWLLARSKHHPDKGGNEEEFKKYKKAWELLSSDEKRQMHDFAIASYLRAKENNNSSNKNNSTYNPNQNYDFNQNSNVLYEIHATYDQLLSIMSNKGFCQFSIDGDEVKGYVQLTIGELISYKKIYVFKHMHHLGSTTSIKFTWDWKEPWFWHPKYGQTCNLYLTEGNIRSGGKKSIDMPDGRRLAFSWKPVDKDTQIKGGLWIKLKNHGWPTNDSLSPDAWVHLNSISKMKDIKNRIKVFGLLSKAFNTGSTSLLSSIPLFVWKALLVIVGLYLASYLMSHFAIGGGWGFKI